MAHCPPELLDDLRGVLDEVRQWPGLDERKAGVFYVRRQPFLHFHLLAGSRRCADIKVRAEWARFDLPRPLTSARRRAFAVELRRRYRAAVSASRPTARQQPAGGRRSP